MASRRFIADERVLKKYGAHVLVKDNEANENDEEVNSPAGKSKDSRADIPDQQPIGISIHGWNITSASSSIGNEAEMDDLTAFLQSVVGDSTRLALPEIVFANAFLSLKYARKTDDVSQDGEKMQAETHDFKFNAKDALLEWAKCHLHLGKQAEGENEVKCYRGVSIIKTVDAKLWEERQAREAKSANTHSLFGKAAIGATEYNYDWCFQSPYAGFYSKNTPKDINNTMTLSESEWKELSESGIDVSLLMDQKQPILYFDDVNLYEDDMHDNGYVSLRCKIRVMPTCFLLLMTLFVRVDHVLVRVKEVRIFSKFNCNIDDSTPKEKVDMNANKDGNNTLSSNTRTNQIKVYRDVTWRESPWAKLSSFQLPTDVKAWRIEDESNQTQMQRIQMMLKQLPQSKLPKDIQNHAVMTI